MPVQTRSMRKKYTSELKKKTTFEMSYDFDSSSRAWRSNKKRIGEGSFTYKKRDMNKIQLVITDYEDNKLEVW